MLLFYNINTEIDLHITRH